MQNTNRFEERQIRFLSETGNARPGVKGENPVAVCAAHEQQPNDTALERTNNMKYVKESAIIFGITMIGEFFNELLPLPVPAGVYGLFLLLLLLCTGLLKLDDIEATGNFLLDIMPILFIPASVGLIESYDAMKAILVPLAVTCLVSTVIVMGVTGKVTEFMVSMLKKKNGKNAGEEKTA